MLRDQVRRQRRNLLQMRQDVEFTREEKTQEEQRLAALRGERVQDSAPRNYGSHTSVIGAMGLRGLVATLTARG